MKKILLSILIIFLALGITACGKKEVDSDVTDSDIENGAEDISELEMYSDDTKLVFSYGNVRYVFYYEGDKVTAYHTYIDYTDAPAAKYALTLIEGDETVKKAYTKGKYLVVEYNESEYEDLSVSTIKTAYSYMKEIKKEN